MFNIDINNIIGIKEAYELPTRLMEILLDENEKTRVFDEFLKYQTDFSFDWFTDYYQQEHGDRNKLKQDFTPHKICELAGMLTGEASSVADICAGTGGLTIAKWNSNKNKDCFYHCEEYASRAIPVLLFNLAIRNMNAEVVHCDCLTREVFNIYRLIPSDKFSTIERVETLDTITEYDCVISNPPYSMSWNPIPDERFNYYGLAPKTKSDYAFLLHGLHLLKPQGKMAIILPHGVLFRGQAEGSIRKILLEDNIIESVIGLPNNLFLNTSIPVCILVLTKERNNSDVYFIDASKEFEKHKSWNILKDDHVNNIYAAYNMRKNIEKYACLHSLESIASNDYNLNIPRYVDTYEEEELTPIRDLAKELLELEKECQNTQLKFLAMLKDLVGTTPESQKELDENREIIERVYSRDS